MTDNGDRTGIDLLRDPISNKGLSTELPGRDKQHTRGLLPPGVVPFEVQIKTALQQVRERPTPMDKYLFLDTIRDSNVQLFYALLVSHTEELLPIVYTPTVGAACLAFSHIYQPKPKGLFISLNDKGKVKEILQQWPQKDVRVIVFSDGGRILGLGDLGSNGMGIPLGKAALYTALGGVPPEKGLGVLIDAGTDNQELLEDPAYIGLRQPRERGPAYYELITEFMEAAKEVFGEQVLLQFEDFPNFSAFGLLAEWEKKACSFNDDIQGTAAVALAGVLAAKRLTGRDSLKNETFLFLGAGEAALGIADLIAYAITKETGMSMEEARGKIWLFDSKGLIVKGRGHITEHKEPFAHGDQTHVGTFLEAVKALRPTGIIGVSTIAKAFNKEVLEAMAEINERPIVFALSNPTSKSECSFEEAVQWTKGKCIFASGSPFPSLTYEGQTMVPGQANNCFIFPSFGLAVLLLKLQRITTEEFYLAAKTLANMVSKSQLEQGCLFPPLGEVREVSAAIAGAIAENEKAKGTLAVPEQNDWAAWCKEGMYDPLA